MNVQDQLDELKRVRAIIILHTQEMATIRAKSLANLDRWNAKGTWCSAHDEWRQLMTSGSDAEIVYAMSSTDQKSNRLRQSPPYAGLFMEGLENLHKRYVKYEWDED